MRDPLHRTALLLCLSVLGVYLILAWQPLEVQVGRFVADDMFYYLQISRNVARGQGASFDGLTLTNGFHPLWAMALSALHALAPRVEPGAAVSLGLSALSLFTVGAGAFLFAALREAGCRAGALGGLVIWLCNPFVLAITHAGVEAPIASCALAAALWWFLRLRARWLDRKPSAGEAAVLGALLALACLGRTDSALSGGLLGLAAIAELRRFGWRDGRRPAGVLVAGGLLPLAPWIAWNLLRFGTILQDSAAVLSGLRHQRLLEMEGAGAIPGQVFGNIVEFALAFGRMWGLGGGGGLGLAAFAAALAGAAVGLRGSMLRAAWLVAACSVLPVLVYASWFWFWQRWYFLGPLLFGAALAGLALESAARAVASRGLPSGLLRIALLLSGGVTYGSTAVWLARDGLFPWQVDVLELARAFPHRLPPAAVVGAFNSGILGYVADSGVVNLDGVVNPDARRALQQHDLLAWMRRRGVTHVIDFPAALSWHGQFAEPSFADAFSLLVTIPTASSGGELVVLALKPPP